MNVASPFCSVTSGGFIFLTSFPTLQWRQVSTTHSWVSISTSTTTSTTASSVNESCMFLADVPPMRPKPYYCAVRREQDGADVLYCTKESFLQARVIFIRWLVSFWLEPRAPATTHVPGAEGENIPKNIQVTHALFKESNHVICT